MTIQHANPYGLLMLGAIVLTAWLWGAYTKRDSRLTVVYFAGLFGAFIGAKIAFLIAETHVHWGNWTALFTGRSVTGALIGGYVTVELCKRWLNYRSTTGDLFALMVPLALIIGRTGCVMQGCCPGVACAQSYWWTVTDAAGTARWPAATAELLFNAAFLMWVLFATTLRWQRGNRFHVYLIAYGLFRFAHEFARDTPPLFGPISGYQLIAVAIAVFGVVRYVQRRGEISATGIETGGTLPAITVTPARPDTSSAI